jgi:hypothetical protein
VLAKCSQPNGIEDVGLYRLDDEHAVEPLLDQLLVDVGLRREDPQLLAGAERDQLALAPVRNRRDKRGRVGRGDLVGRFVVRIECDRLLRGGGNF